MSDIERNLARSQLIEALEQMISGQLPFIEGSRIVSALIERAGCKRHSRPFSTFVGIASETDAVPQGRTRDRWKAAALANHAQEWREAESWAQELGEPACWEALKVIKAVRNDLVRK